MADAEPDSIYNLIEFLVDQNQGTEGPSAPTTTTTAPSPIITVVQPIPITTAVPPTGTTTSPTTTTGSNANRIMAGGSPILPGDAGRPHTKQHRDKLDRLEKLKGMLEPAALDDYLEKRKKAMETEAEKRKKAMEMEVETIEKELTGERV